MPRTGMTPAEIKERAIELTESRMREIGFDKVRLTDIAREIGISHAALYAHFRDKSALMDAVSEKWLRAIDENLDAVCRKSKDPTEKILLWMLTLHRAKIEKVMHDPELFKAFDIPTAMLRPYTKTHMETMHSQLLGLVTEAIAKRKLKNANAASMTRILQESMMTFHHPKLVVQNLGEKREPLLRLVLDNALRGLNLKD